MASTQLRGTFALALQTRDQAATVPVQLALGLRSLTLVDSDAEMRRRLAFALQRAMARKGWKAPDLARAVKRDPSTVDRWTKGQTAPNVFMVPAIAEALGVKPELIYNPPAVPDYLSDYLVEQEGVEAMGEGLKRTHRPRAS